MTKICIARLRSGSNYTEPLCDIPDSFYELMKMYRDRHPEHEYLYYNFGYGQRPIRNNKAIQDADVIVIPSEAEFLYHVPGAIHTLDLKRSNERLDEIRPYFNGKKVLILRSDRRDDEELYATKLFPGLDITYTTIDEIDFGSNVHGMKYHFIKDVPTLFEVEKKYDFCYWGSDKRKTIDGKISGDQRHVILKQIRKSNLRTMMIGRFHGIERDVRYSKLRDILQYLRASYTTLCFNWMDPKATTARYVEAIACGMIPFVWQDYDCTNTYHIEQWQRVNTFEEFVDKVELCAYNPVWFKRVEENLLEHVIKTPEEYYTQFEQLMKERL